MRHTGGAGFSGSRRGRLLARQLTLLTLLQSSGWLTLDALSTETGVSTRTLRRDLAALEDARFAIEQSRDFEDGMSRWKLMTRLRCPLCGRGTTFVARRAETQKAEAIA